MSGGRSLGPWGLSCRALGVFRSARKASECFPGPLGRQQPNLPGDPSKARVALRVRPRMPRGIGGGWSAESSHTIKTETQGGLRGSGKAGEVSPTGKAGTRLGELRA